MNPDDAKFQAILQAHNVQPSSADGSPTGWYAKLKASAPAPETPSYLSRVGSDFATNVNEGGETLTKVAQGELNPFSGGAGMAKNVTTALVSPVTEALSPIFEKTINPLVEKIAGKVSDSKAVQDFAELMGKHPVLGQTLSDLIQTGLNIASLAGGGKAAEKIPQVASNIKDAITPTAEEIAASRAQTVEIQKSQAQATAIKAHEVIDKEVRNIAEKYPNVGDALNEAEIRRGTEPTKVLSSYPNGEALPTMTKGGKMNAIPAINFLKSQIANLGEIKSKLVQTAKENTSLEDFRQAASDRIDRGGSSLTKKAADKADVAKIIDGMKDIYPDGIPATELDKIKTEQANESKSYKSKSPFSADSHAIVGQTAADAVVTKGGAAPIDELNKWLSSHYDAIKVLEKMNGKTPNGGLLSKHFGNITGEIGGLGIGMTVGHPFLGAMAGRGASEFVNSIVNSHFISSPLKRALINNMPGLEPIVVRRALDFLDSQESRTEPVDNIPNNMDENNSTNNAQDTHKTDATIQSQKETPSLANQPAAIPPNTAKIKNPISVDNTAPPSKVKGAIPETMNNIPEELETLAQEARKYKSAEEFVKAQEKEFAQENLQDIRSSGFDHVINDDETLTLYHKTTPLAASGIERSGFKSNSFFADSPDSAEALASTNKKGGSKIIEVKADPTDISFNRGTGEFEATSRLKKDTDGVYRATERRTIDNKTSQELTDLFNKVKSKKK